MLKPTRPKRLSEFLPDALGPAAAKQGFAGGEIMTRWEAIVGPEIAAVSAPAKLSLGARGAAPDPATPPEPATLTLRVEGAFALEVQHRTFEIIERVNAHLGWRCVGAIKLRQGSVGAFGKRRRKRPPAPTDDEIARVRFAAEAIEDEGLSMAIEALGRAALAKARIGGR